MSRLKYGLILSLLFIIMGCNTVRDYNIDNEIVVEQVLGDVHLSIKYMSEENLKEDVKAKINPFVNKFDLLGRRIVVFKFTATSEETELRFNLTDVGLTLNDTKVTYADNLFSFMTYFQGSREFYQIKDVSRVYFLPDIITLRPDKPVEGYFVFVDWYPKLLLDAKMIIPASTLSGDKGLISFDIPVDKLEDLVIEGEKVQDSKEDPNSIFFEGDEESTPEEDSIE